MTLAVTSTILLSPLSASSGAAVSERGNASERRVTAPLLRSSDGSPTPRSETCRSARIGLAWYRGRQRDWLKLRGSAISSAKSGLSHRPRKPRSCPDARYLAKLWRSRSFEQRQTTERWLERFTYRGSNPNVRLGQRMALRYGWHVGAEWEALYALWNHESGWSHTAHNRQGSGACGIPQSMTSCFGYSPRAQIAWGLSYIAGRYGRPTVALSHFYSRSWY